MLKSVPCTPPQDLHSMAADDVHAMQLELEELRKLEAEGLELEQLLLLEQQEQEEMLLQLELQELESLQAQEQQDLYEATANSLLENHALQTTEGTKRVEVEPVVGPEAKKPRVEKTVTEDLPRTHPASGCAARAFTIDSQAIEKMACSVEPYNPADGPVAE